MIDDYILKEEVTYPNGGASFFYVKDDTAIIIDKDIYILNHQENPFAYSLITSKQNEYMHLYNKVYRCLKEDIEELLSYINDETFEIQFAPKTSDRGESLEASMLEMKFEDNFTNVYGMSSLKYLQKEYCIMDSDSKSYFLDYVIDTVNGKYAVEENGIRYHHPQYIGVDGYRRQLEKQNTCTKWGIKLFRFSSEDCQFEQRIEDDIRRYFGDDTSNFLDTGVLAQRKFKLYEHQELTIKEIEKQRNDGIKAFLCVFPTATGKSTIVIEDLKNYLKDNDKKVLILAPSINIINDWKNRVDLNLKDYSSRITICTFSAICKRYLTYKPNYFDYIVVDEAHHAVSPVLKRVIQYFSPSFLIGLTATDQRMDRRKLESVFGTYKTSLSLSQAMDKGIIAKANVYRLETNIDLSEVRFNGKDYINADLEKRIRVSSRNELIADVLEQYFNSEELKEKQGVIFCVNVNHTKEMEKILKNRGFTAAAISGSSSNPEKIMNDFRNHKIRFLCACNMLSEGWDYPELGILVMARPTMSKVLYLQQLGRGLRKTKTKQNVFVIDVVDEYGAAVKPCSMHSMFSNPIYVKWGDISKLDYKPGEFVEVDGIYERIEKIVEVDTETFEDKYGNYLNQEQVARQFYMSTDTIDSWIKKAKIIPDKEFIFGSRKIYLFKPETVEKIRIDNNISLHNDETIYDDFFDFLKQRDYSLSYKMPFLLSFIKHINAIGDADINDVLDDYIAFYQDRIDKGIIVDRKTCPYTSEYLKDKKMVRLNMLTNPFEKFERKRFLYYSKDLGMISMNHALFEKLSNDDYEKIKNQMEEDLIDYYAKLEN